MKLLRDIRLDAERRGLGPYDPGNREPDVLYAWFKHLWANAVRQVGGSCSVRRERARAGGWGGLQVGGLGDRCGGLGGLRAGSVHSSHSSVSSSYSWCRIRPCSRR